MLNCFSSVTLPTLGEMELTICLLERGTLVTKLYSRHRPEQRRLILLRETRQLLWSQVTANTRFDYEGSLEIREIHEIRQGKCSKEFRNFPEDTKRYEEGKCFVVLHGSAFKLKSFSAIALSEHEADNWVRGLRYMIQDTKNAPYPLQVERWLRREYYAIENASAVQPNKDAGQVSVKDFKSFLSSVSCKITTSKLMDFFSEEDLRRKNDMRFDDFARLFRRLIQSPITLELFPNKTGGFLFATASEKITLSAFQKFLLTEQSDSNLAINSKVTSKLMRDFIQDIEREVPIPYFTLTEFLDYLFSKQNDLWDTRCDRVYHDMNQPLAAYWIASSHNTYLTGDQFSSESSCESYARALRMGCRCIELDCWNGPDNLPYIFHGHTITSKIKFKDVITTIKEHAFVTSEYPVVLSIEQNCSLEQQRNMAQVLIEVFGDMLLTQRIERTETQLPSPSQLRRKIILKHKKLPEFEGSCRSVSTAVKSNITRSASITLSSSGSVGGGCDDADAYARNVLKESKLYCKDPIDKTWSLYSFVLTQQELIFSSHQEENPTDDESNQCSAVALACKNFHNMTLPKQKENAVNDELHFGEDWFHGKLEGGRQEADQLLHTYKHFGDGTFLVRESDTFVGDYSLSFWRRNRPNHCRIKRKHENNTTKFYLVDNFVFDSLYSLIVYYRKNMLRSSEFSITLKEPVPQPRKHEIQEWFHAETTKEQAEQALIKMEIGSFLVRPSMQTKTTFVISFTIPRKVKHCRILQEGRLYVVDTTQFESLVALVNYYMRNALYRNVKLLHPVTQDILHNKLLEPISLNSGNGQEHDINDISNYMDPTVDDRVTCKALYVYKAEKPDELSFPKHAIITNVQRNGTMWWRGDYGGLLQRHFPANYVKVIESNDQYNSFIDFGSQISNFSRTDSIEIQGAIASLFESTEPGIIMKLQLQTPCMQNSFVIGFDSEELAFEWIKAIQEAAQIANQMAAERHKKERSARVAKEMSDLIIYFRSVPFREHSWLFYEMSSFPETKAEKLFLQQNLPLMVSYHRQQISRVYPKGQRLDSSNFNPVPFWNVGSQMIALNYQTGDKAMQINQAKFRNNGQCGYLLKPKYMQNSAIAFDPNNPLTATGVKPLIVNLRIIAGRHLFRGGKSNNPLVLVEIIGANFDTGPKYRTKASENGFMPVWNESCEFVVSNPDLAHLRFELQDEDMFSETHFVSQACYPLPCIRNGYRSIILRNKFSEDLELASLLVFIDMKHVALDLSEYQQP